MQLLLHSKFELYQDITGWTLSMAYGYPQGKCTLKLTYRKYKYVHFDSWYIKSIIYARVLL